ncbi:general secretion pathway protein GspE [Myxococcaceae bacterium GXIMD 01537]
MAAPRNRIGDILVKARVIDELQLRSALAQFDQWGGRLSRIVADMALASEETITQAISQGTGVQRVHLGNVTKDAGALAKVDVLLAEQKGVFPVALKDNGKTLVLAMSDPTDLSTLDQVVARSRARVVPMVAGDREIEHAILRHYRNQEPSSVGGNRFNPVPTAPAPDEEDEFKIVDMSGKTVMKRITDIDPRLAAEQPAPAPAAPAAPPPPAASSSAADILDEILAGGGPAPGSLTEEELQRLQAVQVNQEKSSKILRALLELLFEKNALQQRELAARMKM